MTFQSALDTVDSALAVAASTAKREPYLPVPFDNRSDWLAILDLANQHLVAPALWTAFNRLTRAHELPEDVRSYLSLLHTHNVARNERIRKQCLSIGEILAEAGVRAAVLKGATWLFEGSVEPAKDRMMRDIDLLVASQDFDIAVRTLIDSGYQDTSETLVETDHFHYAPLVPKDDESSVEIHRDLAHRTNLLPAAELLSYAHEIAPGLLLPSVHHRILHNIIHAQIENGDYVGGVVNLRDNLDLARLVGIIEAKADWAHIANDARERGLYRYFSGVLQVCHQIFDSSLPEPFSGLSGKIHAWRCMQQRRRPLVARAAEKLGIFSRALAWERDAYSLNVKRYSLKSHLLVNKRRLQRAKGALQRMFQERNES